MKVILVALAVAVVGLLFQRRRGGLVGLLALVVAVAFAAAALAPVVTGFVERAARTAGAELGVSPGGAAATAAVGAAANAGPRSEDLTLTLAQPAPQLPGGPLGARAALVTAPLPFAPGGIHASLPRRPAQGRPVAVAVSASEIGVAHRAQLAIRRDGLELCAREGTLGPEPVELEFLPDQPGSYTLSVEVEVDAADEPTRRVSLEGRFTVGAAPRVLALDASGVVQAALQAQGMRVERVRAAGDDLSDCAAVVLASPPGPELGAALAAALADGLGLFVLAPAFGSPADAIHGQLPLRPEPVPIAAGPQPGPPQPDPEASPPERPPEPPPDEPPEGPVKDPSSVSPEPVEVDKRSIAMVLVIDRSISMGRPLGDGHTVMSYAKTSALETARALTEGDQVGIVTFGLKGAGRVELPLCDARDLGAVRRALEGLGHGDQRTYLLSGLQRAGALVREADAAVKQIIVISDGEFFPTERLALTKTARELLRSAGAATTIVTIGNLAPAFRAMAEEITRSRGGRFWASEAAQGVPAIVSVEVTRALERVGREPPGAGRDEAAAGDPAGEPPPDPPAEPPAEPEPLPPTPEPPPESAPPASVVVRAVGSSPVLAPVPADEWPVLASAVPGTAPLDAQVLLVAGDDGWPLLAFANRGLGRIGAFAADLCGQAGRAWRDDPAFPARLALWVQHVMRAEQAWEPAAIPLSARVEPLVPGPEDVAALEALAGSPARQPAEPAAARPAFARTVRQLLPVFAGAALAALLLLAAAERLAATRRAA